MHPCYQEPARIERECVGSDLRPMVKYKSGWKHSLFQEDSPRIEGLKLKQGPRRYEH